MARTWRVIEQVTRKRKPVVWMDKFKTKRDAEACVKHVKADESFRIIIVQAGNSIS
jgi:hypothetical protein